MDLTHKVDHSFLKQNRESIKRIFFFRICGTGMGAAACLLKEKGIHVEGGDFKFAPPMGDYLKSTGIPCHDLNSFDYSYLKDFDLIVVGNVVARLSDDARAIEQVGVPFTSFPAALGAFVLSDTNVIGVAGTHGKTTTTYLLTQMFEKLGFNPGYLVGGVIDGKNSARLGDGSFFFIESDEYDCAYFEKISKFRRYEINHMIITSLEFDHGDIFDDIEDIKDEFRAAIPEVGGNIISCLEYYAANDLRREFSDKNWIPYGEGSELGPFVEEASDKRTVFSLMLNGKRESFETNVIGGHNIQNLTTGIILAVEQGIPLDKIRNALKGLNMVKRRQEERGTYHGAMVIDDFAHHPRAVKLTIDTIKIKYPGKRLVVVMEPNSATARSAIFQDGFGKALLAADEVIMARPEKPTSIKDVGDLDCYKISKYLVTEGRKGAVAENLTDLRGLINSSVDDSSVLLVLSNGTCLGLWESDFVNELS